MLLQIWSFPFPRIPFLRASKNSPFVRRNSVSLVSPFRCHAVSADDIAVVLHNKVLVAAAVSAAIGQASKPFSSAVLHGKKFDLMAAVRAGGFPSTHSSAAVATATSLGLERGFSDALFGLSVVYACLIMYDAQGVRREVGIHAKELNKLLLRTTLHPTFLRKDANDLIESFSGEPSSSNIDPVCSEEQTSFLSNPNSSPLLVKPDNLKQSNSTFIISSSTASDANGRPQLMAYSRPLMKEVIGHTEIEVAAGALLGLLVSLVIYPYI